MESSRAFREGLRTELPVWESDGILTPGAARALAARYDLDGEYAEAPAYAKDRTGPLAAAAGVGVACTVGAALAGLRDGVLLPLVALAAAFAAAPLVARGPALQPAANGLRAVGRAIFYVSAWALSFVPLADAVRLRGALSPGLLAALPAFVLAAAGIALGLRRTDVEAHARGEAMLLTFTVVAFALGHGLEGGSGTALVANMGLLFLAVGRIVRGVSWLSRAPFWEGLAVAAVLVASRVTDLALPPWLRIAGVGLVLALAIAGGVAFERRRARAVPAPAPAATA